ncbi:ornithine cyclodeaminase family protein [Tropicimonas sp. IMCC6043]|uniref:ornithine cyclodeaminase family protein n=1 Tax=Tropicimonas sp. IMCC6043 TaxID=2510645 RepID=UPI00101CA7CD|nr:ornithine cyclodeaminase family protein [Tropicimonas sp. IMCC6043]RYH07554.1 ornithine cyclodeaminase family protein [Tropicimonas sp. IMCC6043]
MIVIPEALARELVTLADAIEAVERCFVGMARGTARNYPVVRESLGLHDAVFGVKTGCDIGQEVLGLKAGGYWPHNAARGEGNHQSSTLLFDAGTGRASALVSANYLTGVRTGASSAIATKYLSRPDARVLGMIGTGGQSEYQLRATMEVRGIEAVHAWDPNPSNLERFGETVRGLGLEYSGHSEPRGAVSAADIIVTVTPSQAAIVEKGWVRPGTHVSAMGADTKGKQELDPHLVASASLFYDELEQVQAIGEFQHAFALGLIGVDDLKASIGEVAGGGRPGRSAEDEITIYDGTGVALQDLVVADLAVRKARDAGRGQQVEY